MQNPIVKCFLFFLLLSSTSCRQKKGDNDLGSNISLLEGDRIEDRIIVYCSGRSAGACIAGISIVPVYKRQFDSNGQYAEYVETATSNKKWIIAKSVQIADKKENYWIINNAFSINIHNCANMNCDSIIQSHVLGPFGQSEFQNKTRELNIDLNFEKR